MVTRQNARLVTALYQFFAAPSNVALSPHAWIAHIRLLPCFCESVPSVHHKVVQRTRSVGVVVSHPFTLCGGIPLLVPCSKFLNVPDECFALSAQHYVHPLFLNNFDEETLERCCGIPPNALWPATLISCAGTLL